MPHPTVTVQKPTDFTKIFTEDETQREMSSVPVPGSGWSFLLRFAAGIFRCVRAASTQSVAGTELTHLCVLKLVAIIIIIITEHCKC